MRIGFRIRTMSRRTPPRIGLSLEGGRKDDRGGRQEVDHMIGLTGTLRW